ncbi:two-component system sensor histidine kinase NtrB [Thermocrinis minervae]|uniref:histidine kinase n=1 Tax=Thermocrinis minervae TaxID=381751 RepID=A0A1M6Q1Z6_9AQUI|nr:PAS domain-containing sensor histidine kinase [Thermocrinis minervae]SHK14214.1 PAS domain S-box-containing protein [Thermocrinis minervae]
MKLRNKVLVVLLFVALFQWVFSIAYFYVLKEDLLDRWYVESKRLGTMLAESLNLKLHETIDKLKLYTLDYGDTNAEIHAWKVFNQLNGVFLCAQYDKGGNLLIEFDKTPTVKRAEPKIDPNPVKVDILEVYQNEYSEHYVRVKVPRIKEGVLRDFFVYDINLNHLLTELYPVLLSMNLEVTLTRSMNRNEGFVHVFVPIKDMNLYVMLRQKEDKVLSQAHSFLQRAFFMGSISTILLLMVSYEIVMRMFVPLYRLRDEFGRWIGLKDLDKVEEIQALSKIFLNVYEQLRKERDLYTSLFNNVFDGMLLLDEKGVIMKVNRRFFERFNADKESLEGRHISEFLSTDSLHPNTFLPHAILKIGDHVYHISIYTATLQMDEKNFLVCQIKDITDKKELEYILVRYSKLAIAGEIASSIAHQLNNPLASVLGYAEVLHKKLEDPQLKRYAQAVINSALKCADTTKRLLHLAKGYDKFPSVVDVEKLTENVVEILQVKASKKSVIIKLIKDIRAQKHIYTFEWKLEQILLNVVDNAIDSSFQGKTVEVSLRVHDSTVSWEVVNEGQEISKEEEKLIFEPFYTTKESGTGLGLTIVKRFAEDIGAKIELKSQANITRFMIILNRDGEGVGG